MTHPYRYPTLQSAHAANSSFVDDMADAAIAAEYPTNAPDAVSDFEAGVRTVAFSGAANHQAVVNANSSSDLSSVADKKISSSLLLPDPASHSASATGAAASLNTGNDSTPAISVNAANPTDVLFTVSGLASDYSGKVTFTDSTGKADVVPIGGNGTYSANLSNLANGTLTYLMTVSDPAGNVINVDPTATLGDGSANAPSGPAQLPNLLNGYAARPSWYVAGVDYAVGYGSTSLTDWESISQPGVTVNTSTNTVTITGNNITLSGIDFSLHGGAQVVVSGNNDTITKSNFLYGTTMASDADIYLVNQIGGSNLTLSYNVINGNGPALGSSASNQSSLISTSGTGTFTLEYNLLENFNQHALEASNSTENILYQYNLIYNGGSGSAGAHLNYLQFGSGAYTATVEFNTTYQPTVPVSGGEGFQFYNNGSGSVTGTLAYNTMIYGPDGEGRVHVPENASNGTGTTKVSVYDNYIDKKGGIFFYNDPNPSDTYSGDINMVTGALIDAPAAPPVPAAPGPQIDTAAPIGSSPSPTPTG
jgi:hypothetical protein